MTAIVVDRLQKVYDGHVAVDGVSFTVTEGEVLALLGPNGAGEDDHAVGLFTAALRPDGGGPGFGWADLAVVGAWTLAAAWLAGRMRWYEKS